MYDPKCHSSLKELIAFSLGQLTGDEAAVIESHVSECDDCCETLLGLSLKTDTFVQILRDARSDFESQTSSRAEPLHVAESDPAPTELPPELTCHPRYDIVELAGVGGMGNVYRAQHRVMERTVALKVINQKMINDPQAVECFHREVKAAAKLSHPNIVAAHDAGQAGNSHFLIMEYVEGVDLAKVVRSSGRLPVEVACDYVRQAAIGLQHAHEQGMVHRDMKPHNLMLTEDGTVKILDFGLAALTDISPDLRRAELNTTDLIRDGSIMGTPDYISPEQVVDASSVDCRSDIYSLGATFYFLLAGRPPFESGSITEVLKSHADREVEPIDQIRGDIPDEVSQVLARAMSKNPGNRYQTASDLAEALDAFARRHSESKALHEGIRNKIPTPVLAVTTILATVVLGVILYTSFGRKERGDITRDGLNGVDPIRPRSAATTKTEVRDLPLTSTVKTLRKLQFVLIPAGQFTMGTPQNQKATPTERGHDVTITRPFQMSAYEITQEEYEWVMGQNPSSFCKTGDRNEAVDDEETSRFPVENVSWKDAMEFCRRLTDLPQSRQAGNIYRLPTEAEWEYACRAETETTFHFGDRLNGTQANVDGKQSWGSSESWPSLKRVTTVGAYPSNTFGLFDMHGNVWEWCADWYMPDYYTNSPQIDPPGPDSGTSRVIRGGAWDSGGLYARSAAREQRSPVYAGHSLGFRVVRVMRTDDGVAAKDQGK